MLKDKRRIVKVQPDKTSGQEKGSSFTTRSWSCSITGHMTLFLRWPRSHISTLMIKKLCPWKCYATHSRVTQASSLSWSEWWGACPTMSRKSLPEDTHSGVFETLCSMKAKSSVASPHHWHRKSKEIDTERRQIVGYYQHCEGQKESFGKSK